MSTRAAFRLGGNTFRDNVLYPAANFAPGVLPAGLDVGTTANPSAALNRYENYRVDNRYFPEHRVTFNGIAELPVGKGKAVFGQCQPLRECRCWGGYQVAFVGTVVSQSFQVKLIQLGSDQRNADLQKLGANHGTAAAACCRPGIPLVQRLHRA